MSDKKEKSFILFFNKYGDKLIFFYAVGNISENDFAEMCGISIERSYEMTRKIHRKESTTEMSLELTEEELRCLTIYFGRNPTALTPLSDFHNQFLLVARKAGFEVEKPIWEKPKNAVKFTDDELESLFKLLGSISAEEANAYCGIKLVGRLSSIYTKLVRVKEGGGKNE